MLVISLLANAIILVVLLVSFVWMRQNMLASNARMKEDIGSLLSGVSDIELFFILL